MNVPIFMLCSDKVNSFCPVSTVSFSLVFLCYYLLYYNNLYYVKTSNVILGLVTKIVVHFYTDFLTFWSRNFTFKF